MIKYFSEGIQFNFKDKTAARRWLKFAAEAESKRIGDISIIFCSDPYILDVNIQYLGHDYYTDIITFDYVEGSVLSGDLFISIDSVRENAAFYGAEFTTELRRVMVHGLLHLIGYDDHTEAEQKQMRAKEDYYLSLWEKVTGVK